MKSTHPQNIIMEMIVRAIETDMALPVTTGPRAYGSAMPDYIHTELDIWVTEILDFADEKQVTDADALPMLTRQRRSERHRQAERRAKCTPERISEMERVLGWVRSAVWDVDLRKCLLAYATVKARGWQWGRYLNNRNRKVPVKQRWLKRKSYLWVNRALQLIEQFLFTRGIFVNENGPLQIAQNHAEPRLNQLTSQDYLYRDEHSGQAPMKIPEPIALASA